MDTKERITRIKALLSDKAIVEFNIQYNACFTSKEQSKFLRKRTAAAIKEANSARITSALSCETINQ